MLNSINKLIALFFDTETLEFETFWVFYSDDEQGYYSSPGIYRSNVEKARLFDSERDALEYQAITSLSCQPIQVSIPA